MRFGGDKYTALRRTPYRPPACGRESRIESEIHKYSRNAKCRQPLPHTATIRENTLKRPSGRTSFYFFIYVFANKKISLYLLITIYRLNSRKPLRARLRGHIRHNTHPVRRRKIARRTARTYSNRFLHLIINRNINQHEERKSRREIPLRKPFGRDYQFRSRIGHCRVVHGRTGPDSHRLYRNRFLGSRINL